MIFPFIVAWMNAEAPVTAILGTPVRLWRNTVPKTFRESFPRGVATKLGDEDFTWDLQHGGATWVADWQFQFTAKGATGGSSLDTLCRAIIGTGTGAGRKLHRYSGTLGGVEITQAILTNNIENATLPDDASDETLHEAWLDFRFVYVRNP